ncbi:phage tail terminator protein [Acinetobacter schindleri]|uniref:phage tail terminator protein n=1 Tax=Acinetobacter schindleri TaxID=108981 RepID=UPI002DBAC2C6|nr:hypothetical protein [Acinetobacter schindleri]MEB5930142.1 hypothetical protein [Acinetobacter schindleri]
MSNFFAVRAEIAKKLEEIPEFKKIYTPINIGSTSELSQITPCAHVNYLRIRKADEAGRGSINALKQEWDITIVERHAASQLSDGSKAIDKAGELVAKVIPLLSGWRPEASTRPLSLVRISEDFSPTCVYITMVFESSLFI